MPSHQTAMRLTRALESGPLSAAALRAALRRDAYLTETDVTRIVGLYRELHGRRRAERHGRRRSSN